MRARFLLALALFGTSVSLVRADDKPLERAELDKRVVATTYEIAVAGTKLFNDGNHEGCYRLYQGTITALAPLLDHRPKLQATVKELATKAASQKAVQGAFTLRDALDAIQSDIAPGKKTTLWDRLGGEKAVKAVVHDFVLAAAEDKKVNFLRDGKFKLDAAGIAKLEQQLVELVSVVSGGPLKYTGRDMKTAHKGMGITDAEFDALAGHLVATLKKYKVPQAEIDELVGLVASTKGDIVEKK